MKNVRFIVCACALALLAGTVCAAESAAPAASVSTVVVPTVTPTKAYREYLVKMNLSDKISAQPGANQPTDLLVTYTLKMAHDFGRRGADGLLPLTISTRDVHISVNGNQLTDKSSFFPKLTALIDHNWRVVDLFGVDSKRRSFPGINYANMIMLFFLYDGDQSHPVGQTWESHVRLANWPETYTFKCCTRAASAAPAC